MIKILTGQKIQGDRVCLSTPNNASKGFASQRAKEPVIEKTKKIINS